MRSPPVFPTAGTYNAEERRRRVSGSEILGATATPEGVLQCGHRLEIADDERQSGTNTCEGEDDADPPVPDVRCEHDHRLSDRGGVARSAADCAVAIEVVAKADLEFGHQRCGDFVVGGFASYGLTELEMKLERLLTVDACAEVSVDVVAGLIGDLAVDEGFKFAEGVVAVSHGDS